MKRFTLKRLTLSLVTSLMFIASQSVMAQYVPLTVVDGKYSYGQTAAKPGSHAFDKLVDASESTMWRAWFNPKLADEDAYPEDNGASANELYIIVRADSAVVPTFYFLVTSEDIKDEPKNNWSSWKIYGGNFDSDELAVRNGEGWTLIDERNGQELPAENLAHQDLDFKMVDGKTKYQYFWIEITDAVGYYYDGTDADVRMAEWGLGTYGSFQEYLEYLKNKPTGTDEPIVYHLINGAPSTNGGEGVANLLDGDSGTKWCTGFTNRKKGETKNGGYIIFKASRNVAPSYYSLTTANDTQNYYDRNWKQWQLYGMNATNEESVTRDASGWVLLDDKVGVPTGTKLNELPAANYTQAFFTPSEENATAYRYFKVELDECVDDGLMQMADIALGDEYTFLLDRIAIANTAATSYNPDTFAEKALLDEMAALIDSIKTCTDPSRLGELNTAIDEQRKKIDASASSYAELTSARNRVIFAINGGKLSEEGQAYLTAWISETDVVAPGTEYPVGNYAYIKANRQITGEQAVTEANRINAVVINSEDIPEPITAVYKFLSGTPEKENWAATEGPEFLIDGQSGLNGTKSTKWGTGTSKDRFVIFKSINKETEENEPIQPTYYGLVTGGDTGTYTDRNWKNWKIWGANFASDEEATKDAAGWVLIDDKKNVGTDILKTTSLFESYIYLSEGCAVPYTYFKIEVYHDGGMQMNEFTFYNTGNLATYRDSIAQAFEQYDPYERPAYKGYTDKYNAKYEELKTTVNAPDVMKIKNELVDIQELITSSADLYEKYDSVYNVVTSLNIDAEDVTAWQEGYSSENAGPSTKYIRGTYAYIKENLNLDNDEITLETYYLSTIINAVEKEHYILIGGHTVNQWRDGFYGHLIDGIALNEKKKEVDPDTGETKEVEVKATKWGGDADADGDTYIIFRTLNKTNPFFYTLTTGNDTGTYYSRNWGTWYIYGANFEGDGAATKDADGWVLVDSKVDVKQDRLHAVDAEPSYFGFSSETTVPYTYYKVVVTKAYSGKAIQMNELHFGTADEFDIIKSDYTSAANEFNTDVIAEQRLIDSYNALVTEIEECANMEALFRVNRHLETLRDSITACAKVYTKYSDDVEAVKQYLKDNKLEDSEALTTLNSYLNDDLEPNEVFPNGSVSTILDDHVLADSVLTEEIDFLESLKKAAVAAGYMAGSDISSLIVNRSFAKATQVVDKDGNDVSGTRQPEGWDGYVYTNETNEAGSMSAAEFCNEQSKFNISQTLKNLKNGFYEVKLNAGFRPNGNINSLNYTAMAFANDTKTYVPAVREYMASTEAEAWTGVHADKPIYACDIDEDASGDSTIVGYVIWGVQGTINAILQDRYEITMVAKVTDGTLKLGLKNEGTLTGGDWLGAGNFRLTYLGEEAGAEAIAAAATYNGERVTTLTSIYVPGNFSPEISEFKAAPNFGNAQREALADAGNRTTVEELVADGNLFEEINATKAAYYNLCEYTEKVVNKWIIHPTPKDFDTDIEAVQGNLMNGSYANTEAVNVALKELLEKYPDYLEITDADTPWFEVDAFNYEYTSSKDGRVIVRLSNMYDNLKENETILEFEYISDNDVEKAILYNMTNGKNLTIEKLEATSELKKVSISVKDLAFSKSTDEVGLALNLTSGATFNICRMRFVEENGIKGDLNGDGKVTASDIQVVLNAMAEEVNNPEYDLNGDGKITASDIQVILNIMAEQ